MAKVSIIVPVYNGEKYIPRALDSLLNQAGVDIGTFEIICLNDGSKDNSIKILHDYHKRYPKIIRVVDQLNIGVASTRNKGITMATGEYIAFLDQDDFYEPDAFSTMLKLAEAGDYDVIQCGYRRTNNKNKSIHEVQMKDAEYSKYVLSAAWGKLHKTSFLLKNKIYFFDNKYGEDIVFTAKEIFATNKFKIIPDYVAYNWFFNEESVSNTIQRGFKKEDGFDLLLDKMVNLKVPDSQRMMYEYYVLRTVTYYLLKSGKAVDREYFVRRERELLGKIMKHFPGILDNKRVLFGPSVELFSMKCIIATMAVIHKIKLIPLFAYFYCRPRKL